MAISLPLAVPKMSFCVCLVFPDFGVLPTIKILVYLRMLKIDCHRFQPESLVGGGGNSRL